jgi:hypothetical protein
VVGIVFEVAVLWKGEEFRRLVEESAFKCSRLRLGDDAEKQNIPDSLYGATKFCLERLQVDAEGNMHGAGSLSKKQAVQRRNEPL